MEKKKHCYVLRDDPVLCFIDYIKAFDCADHNKLWKIHRDKNIRPPNLPSEKPICRLRRNRTRHGTTDWFKIGKGLCQVCILSACLFSLYADNII